MSVYHNDPYTHTCLLAFMIHQSENDQSNYVCIKLADEDIYYTFNDLYTDVILPKELDMEGMKEYVDGMVARIAIAGKCNYLVTVTTIYFKSQTRSSSLLQFPQ